MDEKEGERDSRNARISNVLMECATMIFRASNTGNASNLILAIDDAIEMLRHFRAGLNDERRSTMPPPSIGVAAPAIPPPPPAPEPPPLSGGKRPLLKAHNTRPRKKDGAP